MAERLPAGAGRRDLGAEEGDRADQRGGDDDRHEAVRGRTAGRRRRGAGRRCHEASEVCCRAIAAPSGTSARTRPTQGQRPARAAPGDPGEERREAAAEQHRGERPLADERAGRGRWFGALRHLRERATAVPRRAAGARTADRQAGERAGRRAARPPRRSAPAARPRRPAAVSAAIAISGASQSTLAAERPPTRPPRRRRPGGPARRRPPSGAYAGSPPSPCPSADRSTGDHPGRAAAGRASRAAGACAARTWIAPGGAASAAVWPRR